MHIPVLLEEAVVLWGGLEGGEERPQEGIYIDATFGEGGHSMELLKRAKEQKIKIIGFDLDKVRIKKGEEKYKEEIKNKKLYLISQSFQNIQNAIESLRKKEDFRGLPVLGVLFDLGFCSTQLEEGRGFSFSDKEASLDMRFNSSDKEILNASEILNSYSKEDLEKIIREYGEEKFARLIAGAVIKARQEGEEFKKVGDLYQILEKTVGRFYRKYHIHFATRTFQGIRIAVNGEREAIEKGLEGAKNIVSGGGNLVAISFHSGEDRMVKQFFKLHSKECICPENFPICRCDHERTLRIITKKPIVASKEELLINPRARSAKLRAAQKII